MNSITRAKAPHKPTVAEMLHLIAANYTFLTPDNQRKLVYGIEMIFRDAKNLADDEEQEIMIVLETNVLSDESSRG